METHKLRFGRFFFEQCRQHLRVVLATDPTSALFSSRLREFPQLISLCHVTCVDQWSSSSRTAVAEVALSRVSLLGPDGLYADRRETIIRACVQIHRTMLALSKDYSSKNPLFRVRSSPSWCLFPTMLWAPRCFMSSAAGICLISCMLQVAVS